MDRRNFIRLGGTGLIAGSFPGLTGFRKNAPLRLALIGTGWWGMNILSEAISDNRIRIVAICDVDENQLKSARNILATLTSNSISSYKDYRELLHKEDTDIIIVATPDHWHPLITIAALEKGNHVYVEKPIGHTINEGKAMVAAARRNNRIVQVGTHRRVSPHNISAMEFLRSGKVGKIGMVRAFVHYGGGPGQKTPDEEAPAGLDWDMWCGPAPLVKYNPSIHPKGFRQHLAFANGQLGDWGIHWMDQILWWTEEKAPRKIFSTAARHIREDSTDAPDTQVVNFEFENFIASWEHRLYAANEAEKTNIGCYFYGTEGTFHLGWLDGWTFYPSSKNKNIIHQEPTLHTNDKHNIRELWRNFMDSVEKKRVPVCDIAIGHRSTNMSLLGMISWKAGRSIQWDPEKELIIGDDEASRLMFREYRHPWKYPS